MQFIIVHKVSHNCPLYIRQNARYYRGVWCVALHLHTWRINAPFNLLWLSRLASLLSRAGLLSQRLFLYYKRHIQCARRTIVEIIKQYTHTHTDMYGIWFLLESRDSHQVRGRGVREGGCYCVCLHYNWFKCKSRRGFCVILCILLINGFCYMSYKVNSDNHL